MSQCPCGSKKDDKDCCEIYINGHQFPATPEALMRSRYTAYTLANINYIKKTMCGTPLTDFDEMDALRWAKHINWIGLCVLKTWTESAEKGYVEFIATFIDRHQLKKMHEISEFIYQDSQWLYYNGVTIEPTKPTKQKISRHTPCPCGNERKFKNCHGKQE